MFEDSVIGKFAVELSLLPSKTIRERTVYSLIELVSEVSGLADILFISAAVFLASYTSQVQKAEKVEDMTHFRHKRPVLHGKSVVTDFLAELNLRYRLGSNFWLTLTQGICPRPCRSRRNASLLKLQAKAGDKIE